MIYFKVRYSKWFSGGYWEFVVYSLAGGDVISRPLDLFIKDSKWNQFVVIHNYEKFPYV